MTPVILGVTHALALAAGVWVRLFVERWWERRLKGIAPRRLYDMGYEMGWRLGRRARRLARDGVPELRACDRFSLEGGTVGVRGGAHCGRCGALEQLHGTGDSWGDFLRCRLKLLVAWQGEGKSPAQSAVELSMDETQVTMILAGSTAAALRNR